MQRFRNEINDLERSRHMIHQGKSLVNEQLSDGCACDTSAIRTAIVYVKTHSAMRRARPKLCGTSLPLKLLIQAEQPARKDLDSWTPLLNARDQLRCPRHSRLKTINGNDPDRSRRLRQVHARDNTPHPSAPSAPSQQPPPLKRKMPSRSRHGPMRYTTNFRGGPLLTKINSESS